MPSFPHPTISSYSLLFPTPSEKNVPHNMPFTTFTQKYLHSKIIPFAHNSPSQHNSTPLNPSKHMEKFIRHYLEVNNKLKSPEHSRLFRPFVEDHLRLDGCFIFKMMDRNLGNVVTDSIIVKIWDTYIEKCKEEGLMASSGSSTPKSKGTAVPEKREVPCQDCGKLQSTPQGRECIQCGVILDV